MFKLLLEKIGLRRAPWWKHIVHGRLLVVVSIIVVAGGVGLLAYALQKGTLGTGEKAERTQSEQRAAQEAAYRSTVVPLMSSYVIARSLYQEAGDEQALQKWRAVARDVERVLLEQTVPARYQDFHLSAVIALSLEASALDDMLGQASDTGRVGPGGLRERGEVKLQDTEKRWQEIFEQEKDWLRI